MTERMKQKKRKSEREIKERTKEKMRKSEREKD